MQLIRPSCLRFPEPAGHFRSGLPRWRLCQWQVNFPQFRQMKMQQIWREFFPPGRVPVCWIRQGFGQEAILPAALQFHQRTFQKCRALRDRSPVIKAAKIARDGRSDVLLVCIRLGDLTLQHISARPKDPAEDATARGNVAVALGQTKTATRTGNVRLSTVAAL